MSSRHECKGAGEGECRRTVVAVRAQIAEAREGVVVALGAIVTMAYPCDALRILRGVRVVACVAAYSWRR